MSELKDRVEEIKLRFHSLNDYKTEREAHDAIMKVALLTPDMLQLIKDQASRIEELEAMKIVTRILPSPQAELKCIIRNEQDICEQLAKGDL